jgi:hypothetical protein
VKIGEFVSWLQKKGFKLGKDEWGRTLLTADKMVVMFIHRIPSGVKFEIHNIKGHFILTFKSVSGIRIIQDVPTRRSLLHRITSKECGYSAEVRRIVIEHLEIYIHN